ncbi:chitin deacetylase [Actinomortierella ambigua]|nr:chitin deacetylase [Actinomortierella ambigua]
MGDYKCPFVRHQRRHRVIAVIVLATLFILPVAAQQTPAENPAPLQPDDGVAVPTPRLQHEHKYHGVIYHKSADSLQQSTPDQGDKLKGGKPKGDRLKGHHHQHLQGASHGHSKNGIGIASEMYPPKDRTPDVNSPQVQQWLKEIDWSKVPKISVAPSMPDEPHFPNCPPDDEVDPKSCWWSCDSCVARDDIVTCPQTNDWGLTYDDGPTEDTPTMMRYLQEHKLTATFFIVGSRVLEYPETLRAQVAQGHHIALHTWSHAGLTTLTNQQIVAEIKWTEKIIRDATGLTTKYIRPPYGDVDNRVREILRQLGYKTVIWTPGWDTNDWQVVQRHVSEDVVFQSFNRALARMHQIKSQSGHAAGPITLEHDFTPETISLSKRLIPIGIQHGLRPMNLAQCLADESPYQRGSKLGPNGAVLKPSSSENGDGTPGGKHGSDFKRSDATTSTSPSSANQQATTALLGLFIAVAVGAGYLQMV